MQPHTTFRAINPTLMAFAVAVACLGLIAPAFAQGSGWEDPAIELLGVFQSGLVQLGTAAVGIAIIVFGAWAAFTERFNGAKIGMIVFGGALIVAGPTMLTALLETLK